MSPSPTATVSAELAAVLRRLKLGQMLDTLPERLTLARQGSLPHADFLEMVLTDEITRRDRASASVRARAAHLDPTMVVEAWDDTAKVSFDKAMWAELTTLRFVEDAANALILGPVGVGKTFLASALGHIACRRRFSVHFERADRLHRRLKATRLDASHDAEMRKLMRVDLLILDDFALKSLDAMETADFYELVVERHRRASTVVTSNRDPAEMLAMMADPLLAQSAIDRLQSAAFELVVEGESYRRRQKPVVGAAAATDDETPKRRRP
ncbi:MAG: ATP-binding protein [Acidimicrobiales bacterium]|nr:ATP-binding protein [Acidimicrobiales bacterium]